MRVLWSLEVGVSLAASESSIDDGGWVDVRLTPLGSQEAPAGEMLNERLSHLHA